MFRYTFFTNIYKFSKKKQFENKKSVNENQDRWSMFGMYHGDIRIELGYNFNPLCGDS